MIHRKPLTMHAIEHLQGALISKPQSDLQSAWFIVSGLRCMGFSTGTNSSAGFQVAQIGSLGGMLALFFIWRRDLVANMIGHWFVDFIGNVLPRVLP
jgi:hypothetical protein